MRKVIIGISAFNHDSSVALIVDGQICGFLEEERVIEQKGTGVLPIRAMQHLLDAAGLSVQDVTDVAFYFSPKLLVLSYLKHNNPVAWIKHPYLFTSKRFIYEFGWMLNFILKSYRIPQKLKTINAKLHFYPHHECHLWYGIYSSNMSEGVIISNDSIGEEVASIARQWVVRSSGEVETQPLFSQCSPNSIGYLYGAVTEKLGFSRQDGAGKVMALASFSAEKDSSYFTRKVVLQDDGTFYFKKGLVVERSYKPAAKRLDEALLRYYGYAPQRNSAHYEIAYGVQKATELILNHQVATYKSKSKNIVMTGGVAQNSVAMGKLANGHTDINLHIPPIPHDAGCAIGAAVRHSYLAYKRLPSYIETALLGTQFSDNAILKTLSTINIRFKEISPSSECAKIIAERLALGQSVGVFRGPMECGPRALGNRSILAMPTVNGITKHLNNSVKFRESFRPYGVIVCESRLHEYFVVPPNVTRVPYMTHVFKVNEKYVDCFAGVIHSDGTCRVQTIATSDRFYMYLFKALEQIGLPRMIINTSLNVMGKPICRTVKQALACFYSSGLENIVFNDKYMVEK